VPADKCWQRSPIAAIRHPTYLQDVACLSASDYRGVLEFLRLAGTNDGPDPFPEQLLAELRQLIPCDVVSYGDFDPDRRGWRCAPRWVGEPQATVTAAIRDAFQALRHQYPHAPSDATPVLRWSDRLSRRAMRRLELYREVGRPLGCEDELMISPPWSLVGMGMSR